MSRPFEAVVYLRPKWAKENGRTVVLASGQVEGMLRMGNQTSFMMEGRQRKKFAKIWNSGADAKAVVLIL
jgi:hypothetical protein